MIVHPPDGCTEATPAISDDLPSADREFLNLTGLIRLTLAARWLGMSPATLRHHVREGQCSARKFDGHWFVGLGTVERWRRRRGCTRHG